MLGEYGYFGAGTLHVQVGVDMASSEIVCDIVAAVYGPGRIAYCRIEFVECEGGGGIGA